VGGAGAVLGVGVIGDRDARWKRAPVVPHVQRVAMVRACRLVDEVIEEPPLVLTPAFLDERRITFVVHGDDSEQAEFFAEPRRRGCMRYVPYEREGPYAASTTALIRAAHLTHAAALAAELRAGAAPAAGALKGTPASISGSE
jgi:glycerol-3-phosphate cytidylyltransferase-like family protein